jgi:F0F1-type ATP synthase assembly protein I
LRFGGALFYNATGALMRKDPRGDTPEAGSLAFTFVALVLVFTGLGYLVDRWLHTGPWVMVAGVFVGAGIGFAYLVFLLFTSPSRGRRDERKDGGEGPDKGPQ